jgi:putative membrane protein
MDRSNYQWFRVLVQLHGSVIPAIFLRVFLCGVFGSLISIFYSFGLPVSYPVLGNVVPSIVLGLLLVFRTNTAYDRFWEGRKLWGNIINASRNLARQIWVFIQEENAEDRTYKIMVLHLIAAFAFATQLHLRSEPIDQSLEELLTPQQIEKLKITNHPPLEIAFWINDYLNWQHSGDRLTDYQMTAISELLNIIVDSFGSCERILRTPLPLAYSIHLKQLLLIYCLALPLQLVSSLGWLTGTIVALMSFTLLGIEEIGLEIENPFGHDPNDLPLDTLCKNLRGHIEDLITLSPSSCHWIDLPDKTAR